MSITTRIVANPPSRIHTLAEMRVFLEFGSFISSKYVMRCFPKGDGHPVILLPGFMASDASMTPLRGVLNQLGHDARPWKLGRHTEFSKTKASILIERIERIYTETGRKVSLVGWSMGGIVAREIAKQIPDHIRNIVTLGSPIAADLDFTIAKRFYEMMNGSTEQEHELLNNLKFAPPVPTTSIYSRSDGIVSWGGVLQADHKETPQTENIKVNCSHLGMAVNPLAAFVITERLAQKEGEWSPYVSTPLFHSFIEAH